MSMLVVVAEPEEIKLIPLAYKNIPVLVTGVGAQTYEALERVNPQVDIIINVGYCGSYTREVGSVVYDADAVGMDMFVTKIEQLPDDFSPNEQVVDMESKWLRKWCTENHAELLMIKTVSDNLSYEQYKKVLDNSEGKDGES